MNKVILIGRLARDPEMRTTESGTTMTYFTIAVNRPYNPQNSNDKPTVDFIGITSWRKIAENIAKFCSKGLQVAVVGHINTRTFDGNDGKKHYRTDIVADKVTFLGSSNKNNSQGNSQIQSQSTQAPSMEADPFKDFGEEIEIGPDDMPF